MSEDPRCCGSGTCIIDTEGRCWCGQQWDGQKMAHAPLARAEQTGREDEAAVPHLPAGSGSQANVALPLCLTPAGDGLSAARPWGRS